MPVGACLHERFHRRVGRVVAQDRRQHIDEHRLAVCARAVQEEQRVFAGDACQAVADHHLQVGDQLAVPACDVGEERAPDRTARVRRALRCGGGHLGHPVIATVRPHRARAQIDHSAWCVERPDVGVPLFGGRGMFGVRARDLLDRGNRGRTGELARESGGVGLERGHPADAARKMPDVQHLVGIPARARPDQPFAPQRAVAPVLAIAAGEGRSQSVLGRPVQTAQQVR